ncbi:50S ribosomal protein L4 [Patescibacteria group bacterium]|nr:50S ribosomal protein L4 [Patescibacteria group bacterium]
MATTIKVYNQDGNVSGDMQAPAFLSAAWNPSLVHQVYKSIASNKRTPIAHTKFRGEVSGGGIKPWRQKGTGRARHGSIRSPLWRHGGVSFGPRNTTDRSQKVNRGMGDMALQSVLSRKAADEQLKVVSGFSAEGAKTKVLAHALKNLAGAKSVLLVLANENAAAMRAAKNIARVTPVLAKNMNVHAVASHTVVVIEQKALTELN